jgi:hypothetical protein
MLKRLSSLLIFLLLLTSFSKNGIDKGEKIQKQVNTEKDYFSPEEKKEAYYFENYAHTIYSQIDSISDIKFSVFELAIYGYEKALSENKLSNDSLLTIVDFSKPSNESRLYTIDLKNKKLIFKELVAHGINSGSLYATNFSNSSGSKMSSIGFYITNETYFGSNGFSLKLDGLENGFNNNARVRGVVVHGANYVNKSFAHENAGRLGRSFGCPALPMSDYAQIIETIKGKSCFFIYAPDNNYLTHSSYISSILRSKLRFL